MSNARNLARLLPNASGQLPDAAMSSGSVLQVVTAYDSGISTTAIGWTGTSLQATITPISASSRILVMTTVYMRSSGPRLGYRVTRNGTVVVGVNESFGVFGQPMMMTQQYIDSPASTSALTYQWQMYLPSSGTAQTNDTGGNQGLNPHNVITLIEIAG